MKKWLLAAFSCAMLFSTVPVFAAETVDSVYLKIVPDDEDDLTPGEVYDNIEPYAPDDSEYYVDSYDTSGSDHSAKKSYTYTIDILPQSGYKFANDVDVEVYGSTQVTIKSKSTSKVTVKVKTYPYYVLNGPENIVINESTKKATWDKVDHANKYRVKIKYTTSNDDERETEKTVSTNSIDLKGYIGKYSDVDISVRALKGTSEGDKFISNSDWILSSGSVDEDNSDDNYEFSIPSASVSGKTNHTSNSSSSSSPSKGPGSSSSSGSTPSVTNAKEGWNGSGNDWYYFHNGAYVKGWLCLNSDWFYLDGNGKMLSGWQQIDGHWYLLNTNHDGSYGKMLTGWQLVNGKWYCLKTVHDGYYGALYVSTTTPDGYRVDSSGAWVK